MREISSILIPGDQWPKLMIAPEEHIGPKVAVVTTSTSWASSTRLFSFAIALKASAVTTTAFPALIFSLIWAIVFAIEAPLFAEIDPLKGQDRDQMIGRDLIGMAVQKGLDRLGGMLFINDQF